MNQKIRKEARLICLIIVLTIYSPIELTRVIIVNEIIFRFYENIPVWRFMFECAFIWIFYLSAVLVLLKLKGLMEK